MVIFFLFVFLNQILDEKVEWSAQPKVGSKDNITHKPGGGDKKVSQFINLTIIIL